MHNLKVNLPNNQYKIYIEKGLLHKVGEMIAYISKTGRAAIITDINVNRLYGNQLKDILEKSGLQVKIIYVESGEKSKSLITAEKIYNKLLDFNITRNDLIIAFGGGVVGDLTGFVASTYLRGVPYIQIPTSLLAQVDGSVGGKVAVNLTRGKNLIGSFYHPIAVFIDTELLNTLDKRYLHDGMSEVIKYGCIKDKKLFDDIMKCETKNDVISYIDEIVYTCCNIKREIVEKDERDLGDRMILNFGHTIGHAIEKYFKYSRYTHGEAVAIGMYNITRKSEEMGITEKGTADAIKNILKKYKLPYNMPDVDREAIIKAIKLDKKNKGEKLNIILLKEIGEAYIQEIDIEDIGQYY